jgi:hypothetical protein
MKMKEKILKNLQKKKSKPIKSTQKFRLLNEVLLWELIELKYKYLFHEKERISLSNEIFDEFLSSTGNYFVEIEKKYLVQIEKLVKQDHESPLDLFDEIGLFIEKKLGNFQNKFSQSRFYGENKPKTSELQRSESSKRLSEKIPKRKSFFNTKSISQKTGESKSFHTKLESNEPVKENSRKSFVFSVLKKNSGRSKNEISSSPEEIKSMMDTDGTKRKVPDLDFDK